MEARPAAEAATASPASRPDATSTRATISARNVISKAWHWYYDCLAAVVASGSTCLSRLANIITLRPWLVIATMLMAIALCSLGWIRFRTETRMDHLWCVPPLARRPDVGRHGRAGSELGASWERAHGRRPGPARLWAKRVPAVKPGALGCQSHTCVLQQTDSELLLKRELRSRCLAASLLPRGVCASNLPRRCCVRRAPSGSSVSLARDWVRSAYGLPNGYTSMYAVLSLDGDKRFAGDILQPEVGMRCAQPPACCLLQLLSRHMHPFHPPRHALSTRSPTEIASHLKAAHAWRKDDKTIFSALSFTWPYWAGGRGVWRLQSWQQMLCPCRRPPSFCACTSKSWV